MDTHAYEGPGVSSLARGLVSKNHALPHRSIQHAGVFEKSRDASITAERTRIGHDSGSS